MSSPDTTAASAEIEAWRRAFIASNGREPDSHLTYEAGWIVFRSSNGIFQERVRRGDLATRTARLMERVNDVQY